MTAAKGLGTMSSDGAAKAGVGLGGFGELGIKEKWAIESRPRLNGIKN